MHKVLSQSIAAEFTEVRSLLDSDGSVAAGGPALTTTVKVLSVPFGARWISLIPHNFVGADGATARFALTPRLTIVATTDLLVTGTQDQTASPTALSAYPTQVISDEMQDGDVTDFAMDDFTTFALSNAVYVGANTPFRGVAVDIGTGPNGTNKLLTVKYPANAAGAWTDISDSDGTEVSSGSTTMAVDGNVTWTVPTAWTATSLNATGDTAIKEPWATAKKYWTRWEVDGALDSDWDLAQMRALAKTSTYAELPDGRAFECAVDTDTIAGVEVLTSAGTANIVANAGVLDVSVTGKKEGFR